MRSPWRSIETRKGHPTLSCLLEEPRAYFRSLSALCFFLYASIHRVINGARIPATGRLNISRSISRGPRTHRRRNDVQWEKTEQSCPVSRRFFRGTPSTSPRLFQPSLSPALSDPRHLRSSEYCVPDSRPMNASSLLTDPGPGHSFRPRVISPGLGLLVLRLLCRTSCVLESGTRQVQFDRCLGLRPTPNLRPFPAPEYPRL